MRVELRLEEDEHEYAVTLECDRKQSPDTAIAIASDSMRALRNSGTELS